MSDKSKQMDSITESKSQVLLSRIRRTALVTALMLSASAPLVAYAVSNSPTGQSSQSGVTLHISPDKSHFGGNGFYRAQYEQREEQDAANDQQQAPREEEQPSGQPAANDQPPSSDQQTSYDQQNTSDQQPANDQQPQSDQQTASDQQPYDQQPPSDQQTASDQQPANQQQSASASQAQFSSASQNSGATRTERDLLGEKPVPAEAYYGVQTARALENFQISPVLMNTYPEFVDAFVIVKVAAARANTEVGAMMPDRLAAIERAGQAVMDGMYRDQFKVDWYQGGAGTSANMNANEVLANIGLELTGHQK